MKLESNYYWWNRRSKLYITVILTDKIGCQ